MDTKESAAPQRTVTLILIDKDDWNPRYDKNGKLVTEGWHQKCRREREEGSFAFCHRTDAALWFTRVTPRYRDITIIVDPDRVSLGELKAVLGRHFRLGTLNLTD